MTADADAAAGPHLDRVARSVVRELGRFPGKSRARTVQMVRGVLARQVGVRAPGSAGYVRRLRSALARLPLKWERAAREKRAREGRDGYEHRGGPAGRGRGRGTRDAWDHRERDPAAAAADRDQVAGLLARMSGVERQVITLRFGLGGEPPLDAGAVGGRLGMTRERVERCEAAALARARGDR